VILHYVVWLFWLFSGGTLWGIAILKASVRCRRHCVAVRISCRVRSLMQVPLLQRSIFGERTMPIDWSCGFKCGVG
jgi:hypothetical protein